MLTTVTLDDKYTARSGRIYLSGIQALVRLPMVQRWRDEAAGLNTAGFVSGYRGSPLGPLDEQLWKTTKLLQANHVRFVPGVNEDLAMTAVWGSQQTELIGPARYDGVFGLWYGKGPGVDRCGDVMKHANHFGTSKHGGVLLVAGDDHGAYSSTLPHQSDHIFIASMVPVLYPCNVQEYLDLGLHGWAMSRYSGCFVGFKALADTVESSSSVDADIWRVQVKLPEDFTMPPGGLNARLTDALVGAVARQHEALMQDYKIYAALAYARANRLNRIVIDSPKARLGIVASGKSYMDVLEAFDELGLDAAEAARIGVRLFKVSMPWPLEPDSIREFATGLEEILVVEEKRQIVEYQLKEQLYNWREDVRPRVIGKFDEQGEWVHPRGEWLLPPKADFSIAQIARVIAQRINRFAPNDRIRARLAFLDAKEAVLKKAVQTPSRPAYYCAGCPHNTSTKVPEGSLALAGIGCHVMASSIYGERTKTITHMGGEGATWIGQAPFSKLPHLFANLGDGTYYHSGYLAIRAAVAANVNMTYKILYNDAVAMTGGQPVDGPISVDRIARQIAAEGVKRIAIVADDLSRYTDRTGLPVQADALHLSLHDRAELDAVQRSLRDIEGVSVLIYDQTCAAEKRRRRKKNEYPDPPRRIFINEAVCEGCGDCGVQSNCVAILPAETDWGRKRRIDQSACNKDYSCTKGFCPSFVTVHGGKLKRQSDTGVHALPDPTELAGSLAAPVLPTLADGTLDSTYNILVTGVGGTGVITVGALVGMAAHLEQRGVSVLDMTGMSQKNGAVTSHVRLAGTPEAVRAQAIATGEADLVLGCDMLTAAGSDSIAKTRPGRTHAVINLHQQPPGTFTQNRDWQFPDAQIRALIDESIGERASYVDATRLATALCGDSIATNLFMLGFAWQRGLIPLQLASIDRAIELNAVAVDANRRALAWGRLAADDMTQVERLAAPNSKVIVLRPQTFDAIAKHREQWLERYQNRRYAKRYREFIDHVRQAEGQSIGSQRLAVVVARQLGKLMAYKDEYEVARLYSDGLFDEQLAQQFDGPYTLSFHLAPPLLARRDEAGRLTKREFGPWVKHAFKWLARLKFLRATPFDPFGRTEERRTERAMIDQYKALIERILPKLTRDNVDVAVQLAALPDQVRGYGHVKHAALEAMHKRQRELEAQFFDSPPADAPPAGDSSADAPPRAAEIARA